VVLAMARRTDQIARVVIIDLGFQHHRTGRGTEVIDDTKSWQADLRCPLGTLLYLDISANC